MRRILMAVLLVMVGLGASLINAQNFYKPLPLTEKEKEVISPLVGRSLYLCGYAKLTGLDFKKTDDDAERLVWGTWVPPGAFDHMKPIPIAAIEKVGEVSGSSIWALRLQVGGHRYFTLRSATKGDELLTSPDPLGSLIKNSDSHDAIELAVPKYYTSYDLSVIHQGGVERGMSDLAMECSIGYPEETNDYGRAGKQYVYRNGALIVYTDETDKVVDVQRLPR
jgi:hypothetical protein